MDISNKKPRRDATSARAAGRLWRRLGGRLYHRQHYRLTTEGTLFLFVMALVGFAAWHSGTNLLYLVFATMIAFFLAHGFLVYLSLLGLDVRRVYPRTVRAGEPARFGLAVANRRPLASSYGLRITDRLADGRPLGIAFLFRAPRRTETEASYEVTFPLRGVYRLDRLDVATRFPFGMVERSFSVHQPGDVIVFPQVADAAAMAQALLLRDGEQQSDRRGAGTDLFGIREYVPGEHARRIHWRSTARALRLMVMEFEREEHRKATIVLRNLVSPDDLNRRDLRHDFELAVVMVASLADRMCRAGQEVGLLASGGVVPAGTGEHHLTRILAALARLELSVSARNWPADQMDRSSVVEVRYRDWYPGEGPVGDAELDARGWALQNGSLRPATRTKDAAGRGGGVAA